jgi:hypothetical protein
MTITRKFPSHQRLCWLTALTVIVLLHLACSVTPASAMYDEGCDPFEGGEPQSSKKCPCSTYPDNRYYCASAVQYTVFEITEKVRALFLSILETIARVLWLAARFIANIAEALLRGQVWQVIREGILEQLQTVMGGSGGVLARVTGGGNGLFLIALLLAGLVMTFPLLGATRLVQADRAILWGVVLFALFISGTQGFDLTNAIESLRVRMIETIAEGDTGDGLIDLVALPVSATQDEARQLDTSDLMVLPRIMKQSHFIGLPSGSRCQGGGGADECQKYRVIAFETNIAGQDLEYMFAAVKYKPDVIDGRQKQYFSGLVRMVVAVLAAVVLMLFGIVFALLTAASLVLIIFFFAMLPLGFFEFGGAVLSGLMRQYTSVVGLSLFIAVMVRLMEGVTGTIFGAVSDFSDVLGLLTYLGMLLIVGLGLQMAVRTAWGLMDGTFTVLRASVQTVGSMAFAVGGGPLGGITHLGSGAFKASSSAVPNTAVNAAMAAGAGLAAGGLMLASISDPGGQSSGLNINHPVADVKPTAVPAQANTQLLADPAKGIVSWERFKNPPDGSGQRTVSSQDNHFDIIKLGKMDVPHRWGNRNFKPYLTPDLTTLTAAEEAYFERGDTQQAFLTLQRAFGSQAMADEVLGVYEIRGKGGAEQARQVVENTQDVVDDLVQHGQAIIGVGGRLTPTCGSAVLANLCRAGLYDDQDLHQSAFVGRLAGATLRSTEEIWDDPQAPRKLAHAVFDPDHTEVQVSDLSAQYRLRDAAERMGWDEDQLTHAFAVLPQAEQKAVQEGSPVVDGLLAEWQADPQFAEDDKTDLREVARLVSLVGGQAQVQVPHPMPWERADLVPAVATITHEGSDIAVSAPYSSRLNQRFRENLPPRDYHWDVDQTEWHISPGHDESVRKILYEAADENGWLVDDDQQAENEPGKSIKPVNDTVADTVAESGDMDHLSIQEEVTGDDHYLDSRLEPMPVEDMGGRDSMPYLGSDSSGYAETRAAPIEFIPSYESGTTTSPKPSMPEFPQTKANTVLASKNARSGHISPIPGSMMQTDNPPQVGELTASAVPDAADVTKSPVEAPR